MSDSEEELDEESEDSGRSPGGVLSGCFEAVAMTLLSWQSMSSVRNAVSPLAVDALALSSLLWDSNQDWMALLWSW